MTTSTAVPPQNLEAEIVTLGSMMLKSEVIPDIVTMIRAEDFYRPAHAITFKLLVGMMEAGKPIDLVTVHAEAQRQGVLQSIAPDGTEKGGREYLNELVDGTPNANNAKYYAGLVRDAAMLRDLIRLGGAMQEDARSKGKPAEAVGEEYQQRLYDATTTRNGQSGGAVLAGDGLRAALADIEAEARGESKRRFSTGFPEIDGPTGGLARGDLFTIAGAAGVGKTTLGLSIAAHLARQGHGVLVVSAEMREDKLGIRLASAQSGVWATTIRDGKLNAEEAEKVKAAQAEIDRWRLMIEPHAMTAGAIASRARQLAAKWRKPLSLIVVDSLLLMKPSGGDTRAQQVSGIVWGLKQAAMDLGTPIVLLTHFSREGTKQNVRPALYHLKESGDTEGWSDVVLLLYRPPEGQSDTDGAELVWAKVAKCRDGFTTPWPNPRETIEGAIQLRFRQALTRFETRRVVNPEGENHV